MRRIRLSLFGLGLLAAMPSFAGPAGTLGPAAIAAPDKVYPPLPTLAMLPPASGGGEPAPATTGHRKVATLKLRKSAEPMPRMVVSDASHAYLASIEHQLEQALQK
ncbi:hypothetical protein ACI2VF_17935 [Ralstonia nicotianae]